jgi:hypothetical protein
LGSGIERSVAGEVTTFKPSERDAVGFVGDLFSSGIEDRAFFFQGGDGGTVAETLGVAELGGWVDGGVDKQE